MLLSTDKTVPLNRPLLIISLSLILSCLIGCKQNNTLAEQLQGHWHMEHPYHLTLDVKDSFVTVNKFSLIDKSETIRLYDSVGRIKLPLYCGGDGLRPAIVKIILKGDTLLYEHHRAENCHLYPPMKFSRSNPKQCKSSHVFIDRAEMIQLDQFPQATKALIDFDSLKKLYPLATILAGYAQKPDLYGSAPKIFVNDLFIEITDIPFFIRNENNQFENDVKVVVCLVIDAKVPAAFTRELINAIPIDSVSGVFELVSKDGDFGYQVN